MITADENPFRVTRVESLPYRAPDFSWDDFLTRLEANGYRGAVVGPHGSGKTTLLVEAQDRLEAQGIPVAFRLLNDLVPRKGQQALRWVQELADETVLFLDGAEQLDVFTWTWLRWKARRLRGLVVSIHRPGRMPTLHETRTDEALLRALLAELGPSDFARRWPRARAHFATCHGNLREVFFALYDDCARENT